MGKVFLKINSLLTSEGICVITTTKHSKGKEGFFKKRDYLSSPKRFRKKWTKAELLRELKNNFEILDYFEKRDLFKKNWMIFVLGKK